jgi:hypothetical protein
MSRKKYCYSRDEFIEAVATNSIVQTYPVKFNGWGKSRGSANSSGTITLYFRGNFVASYHAPDSVRRKEWMEKQLRNIKNLEGEKYFLWQPL